MNKTRTISVLIIMVVIAFILQTVLLIRTASGEFRSLSDEIETQTKEYGQRIDSVERQLHRQQILTEEKTEEVLEHQETLITALTDLTEEENENLQNRLHSLKNLNTSEFSELRNIIEVYIDEVMEARMAEQQRFDMANAELDVSHQQLVNAGKDAYERQEFAAALEHLGEVLDENPGNMEAVCYYFSSLFYMNPGDGSNFFQVKDKLVPLIDNPECGHGVKKTALQVLVGISREENDSSGMEKYNTMLVQLKAEN